jgi:hypothetical protein
MPVEFSGLDAGDAFPEAAPVVPVLVGGGHVGRQEEAHRAHCPADQHLHTLLIPGMKFLLEITSYM